jgi:hypothetical protein
MTNLVEILKKYEYVGVRALCDDENYNVGDVCRNSYDWDFENDCSSYKTDGIELYGTCAIDVHLHEYDLDSWEDIDIINELYTLSPGCHKYHGKLVLIGGYNAIWGDDPNEIIIKDAIVLHIQGGV